MTKKQPKTVKLGNPLIERLLQNLIVALFIHWVFQGMLYMDKTERRFKLFIDFIITIIWMIMFGFTFRQAITGFLVGHTLNFLFNAQINVVLKNFGISRATKPHLLKYLQNFKAYVERNNSIYFSAAYGSLSRETIKNTSDLDIRVIRKTGLLNGVKACSFVLIERCRCLFLGIPIDIYVLDDEKPLLKLRENENAIVLKKDN